MEISEPFVFDESPSGRAMLQNTYKTIRLVVESHDRLLADLELFDRPGTEFAQVSDALPATRVSLARSMVSASCIARMALEEILSRLEHGEARAVPLAIHARAALLSAGRIVYCLGSASHKQRVQHARRVLMQETASYSRALKTTAKFEALTRLVPDETVVREVGEQLAELKNDTAFISEGGLLAEMAEVVAAAVVEAHPEAEGISALNGGAEHVAWMFQWYSGFAHGYGWPSLAPPADFIADFGYIAAIAWLAMELLEVRTGRRPG